MKLRDLFLGKPVHWLVPLIGAGALAVSGPSRMHVTDFNLHTAILAAAAVAMLALVLLTTRGDERVTRDPLPEPDDPVASDGGSD